MIDNIPQCVRKNLTDDLPITLKRRSAGSRRVPLAGWGFDSQPDDLDLLAKRFVLPLDTLNILPDVLLVLQDSFKKTANSLLALLNSFKICQIVLKPGTTSYLHC